MRSTDKTKILAYLPGQTTRRFSPIRLMAIIGVLLSGAVAAVMVSSPNEAPMPESVGVQESLQIPPYEFVDFSNAPFVHEVVVLSGDTVSSLLGRLGVQDPELSTFVTTDPPARSLFKYLKPGTMVVATTSRQGKVFTLSIPKPGNDSSLVITRKDGALVVLEQPLQLEPRIHMVSGTIRSSLFAATDEVGLPDSVAVGLTEIFGSEIDFHRDLRRGDSFNVVYEVMYNNGAPVRSGRVLSAEFVNDGKRHTAVWYASSGSGKGDYYTADGRSLRQGFLRSPLEFSRVSSGFQMRFHPILKQWRAHNGVDFAATTGTRVKAAADGVVEFAGRQNGYGNLIVLRHERGYSTAYGHLNGFASGVRQGMKVEQGQLIGFVGSTGWATGPHLHYEFRINGVHQNPLTVSLPNATPLAGSRLVDFRAKTEGLVVRLAISAQTGGLALRN